MKTKRILAFILTICMMGGMLPAVFAADADTGIKLVFDFASTSLLKPDGTPNINVDKVSNTPTVRESAINTYTLDRTRSTGYWKYESNIGLNGAAFQFNGLLFYTATKEQPLNSNAIIFTINIPSSGTYSASVSDYKTYAYGEQTDIYIVNKDVAAKKGINVTNIAGVQALIAESSMTDPAAAVKHIASYDSYNESQVEEKLAENVYLNAGDYYMVAVVNEGTTPSENASKTYAMISKLILESKDASSKSSDFVYSFIAEAVKNNSAGTSVDMRLMKNYTQLDSSISTGAWIYSGICHRMDGYTMYSDKDGGATFRAATANLGNNAFILKAKVDETGIYKPSMIYTTNPQYGTLNFYFVPVAYADSKWTMSATDLNLSEVFADSGVKLVASQDGWVKSGTTANAVGEYGNVRLEEGEYYVLVSLFAGSGQSTHASNTYFKTKGLTLALQPEVSITASKSTLKIGETATVSATLKDESGNLVPTSSITYKSLTPSVASVDGNGVVTGVKDGVATIQVTASSCGVEYIGSIEITVSSNVKYVFASGATDGTPLEFMRYTNVDSSVSAPWRYMCKTNIDTGNVNEYGLNFRVLGNNIGNGGYVLKISVETPGVYTPAVTWTARASCSIVDTYIVPAAYANTRWPMTNNINLAEIVADPGVTLVASADMSTGEKKSGKPIKLSDDEYYVVINISDIGNGNDSQGRAFGFLKSLELNWVSALSEDVDNKYVSLAIANNVNDNIEIKGNKYTRGDEVEIEASEIDGYTFRHWVRGTEENGEYVSSEAKFTYELITNAYLTAVYTQNTTANIVEFFGGNGEYITSVDVIDGAVAAPSAPKLTGFKFIDWYTAKDKLLSETILDAAVTRAVAVFGDTDESFTVAGEENLKYDTKITKTYEAQPVVWYRDDVRVGYGTTYEYFVWDNVGKITYVEGKPQPLVVLDKAVKDGNARMIEYDAGGKTIVEVGILFGDSAGATVDSCKYKAVSKKKASHGQFTAKPYGDESYARGYMIYLDNGEYKVVYSD